MELRRRRPASRLALAAVTACAALAAIVPGALAADLTTPTSRSEAPRGFTLDARGAERIAERRAEVRGERAKHGRLERRAYYTRATRRWRVSYFAGDAEVAQVIVDDRTGGVVEAWTGPQVAWRMARGYEGAFGRKFNAPYVWIPLGLLFLAPFVDPRRPFRILHLDLLVMCGFAVSHVFFNRGEVFTSVPLVYPVLAYLLVRLLLAGLRPRAAPGPVVPYVPIVWLAVALVFLVGFRATLNVVDSNVIDVGYASVVGADRVADGDGVYGEGIPEPGQHGDTYGPLTYLLYVPFEQALSWDGRWGDVPAAHAAALTFDLLTLFGLLLLGRRLRPGREGWSLGVVFAFAWAAYPYSLFVLATNANDGLVAMLVVFALLAVTPGEAGRPRLSGAARGALAALAASAKLAPAVLAPLLIAGTGRARTIGALVTGALAFVVVAALALLPLLPESGLGTVYERTIGYQAGRDSPFSIWGQEPGLAWLQTAVGAAVVLLAAALVAVPRRRDARAVAALGAALLVGVQLTLDYWFYLYIAWFAPLAFVALLGGPRAPAPRPDSPVAPVLAGEDRRVTPVGA